MFKIEINTEKVIEFLKSFIPISEKSAESVMTEEMEGIKEYMRQPGRPVVYPINWDSEKQRRFVIAKLKAENNLPYKRTGSYVNSWKIVHFDNGLQLSAKHPAGAIGGTLVSKSSSQALGGASFDSWQSKIHRGRWRELRPRVLQAIADMPKRVIELIKAKGKES